MIKVVCCITDNENPGYKFGLKASCRKFGIDLMTICRDSQWTSHRLKDRLLKEYLLTQHRSQIVLFTDAYDTLFLGGANEIYERYATECGANELLVSAEKNCFPDQGLTEHYPKIYSPYRYVNSGGIIGPAESFLFALNEIDRLNAGNSYLWSNQYLWTKIYLANVAPIRLDTKCVLFQTMCDMEEQTKDSRAMRNFIVDIPTENYIYTEQERFKREFTIENKKLTNNLFKTTPVHLHFNSVLMKFMMFREPFGAIINTFI